MEIMKCKGMVDASGQLNVKVQSPFQPGEIELVVIAQPGHLNEKYTYDFSDLVGKLSWNGDALSVQKQLRHEWT